MSGPAKRYRAFISYSQKDKPYAKRLHEALERYRLPHGVGAPGGRSDTRRLGRFFRDDEEMGAATDLGAALQGAIADSESLIVVCSPRAAQSQWVNAEVAHFKRTGRAENIFAVIVDGVPHSGDPNTECFPPALRYAVGPDGGLTNQPAEPLGVDLRKESFARVRARLASGLLDVPFDSLWRRDRRRARARGVMAVSGAFVGAATVAAVLDSIAVRQLRSDMAVYADRLLDEGEVRTASALAVGALSSQTDVLGLFSLGEDRATRRIAETTLYEAAADLDPVADLGGRGEVTSFDVAPDGSAVFISELRWGGSMWNPETWTRTHRSDWRFIEYSPNSEVYLAQGGPLGETPGLQRVSDGTVIARYDGDSFEEYAFSNDGRWLAYSFRGTEARLVDASTGDVVLRLERARDRLADTDEGFEFLEDGSALIFRFFDGRASFVSLDTLAQTQLPSGAEVVASPAGGRVAAFDASGELTLWDSTTGEQVARQSGLGPHAKLLFASNGAYLIAISLSDSGRYAMGRGFVVLDARSGAQLYSEDDAHAWSDGEIVAAGGVAIFSRSGRAALFDLESLSYLQKLSDLRTPYTHYSSPDGRYTVFLDNSRGGLLFDVAAGRQIAVLGPPDAPAERAAETVTWAPDHRHLAVRFSGTGNDKLGGVWRVDDGSFVSATGEEGSMFWGTFSADGSYFAPSSSDSAGLIFNLGNGERSGQFEALDTIGPVSFSADSRYLLASASDFMSGGVTQIWDAATGDVLLAVDRTRSSAFAPTPGHIFIEFRDSSGAAFVIPTRATERPTGVQLRQRACLSARERIPALRLDPEQADAVTERLFARLARRPSHPCDWEGLLSSQGWLQWARRLSPG